jgi:hypothetical protein
VPKIQGLVCLGVAVLVAACATTTTKMSGTWQAPDFVGKSFNHILVLGVAKEERNRRMYEDKMVESLGMVGSKAVASYRVLPKLDENTEASVKALVARNHYDGVLVTRLVAVDSKLQHVKGQSYVVPNGRYSVGYPNGFYAPGYNGFYRSGYYGYYRTSYTVVNEPGYDVLRYSAVLETNFYDVESEQLVWSGRSTTVRPQSAGNAIPSITSTVSRELKKAGVLE